MQAVVCAADAAKLARPGALADRLATHTWKSPRREVAAGLVAKPPAKSAA